MKDLINENHKEHAKRIRYSIINSITLFSSSDSIELIPIIDRFLLFFQDNIGIEIRENNNKVIFSFAEKLPIKPYLKIDFLDTCISETLILLVNSEEFKYKIIIYNFDSTNTPKHLPEPNRTITASKLNSLITELNNDDSDGLKDFIHRGLKKAFDKNSNHSYSDVNIRITNNKLNSNDIDNTTNFKIKEVIRKILDDVFESFKGNPVIYSEEWKMIKFFTVIRYPSDLRKNEEYTAQILLSTNQFKSVNENKQKCHNDFTLEIFEKPLSGNDISLADICFKLDTVQFGLGYDLNTQPHAETELYKSLIKSDPKSVFYVPIHVNGCPWIAIYRIIGENEQVDNWSLNYEMYSQYTLLIAEKIRLIAKEVIINLIDYCIKSAITSNRAIDGSVNLNGFIDCLNVLSEITSCYFPFPVPIFKKRVSENSTSKYLNSISDNDFDLVSNSIWHSTVSYTQTDCERYKDKIKDIIKKNADYIKASTADRDLIAASYGLSHFYGNRLKIMEKPFQRIISLIRKNFSINNEMNDKLEKMTNEFHSIEDLSNLITIISKQYTDKVEGPFFESCSNTDYLKDSTYDIKSNIEDIFYDIFTETSRKLFFKSNSVFIDKFIFNKVRPFDTLYNNLIIEILLNFKKSNASHLIVDIDKTANCIYFMNEIKKDPSKQYSKEWQPVTSKIFWGALYYLHLLIKETKVGEIVYSYQPHSNNQKIYYRCGLILKGLKYE